jgi:hypothetical protein
MFMKIVEHAKKLDESYIPGAVYFNVEGHSKLCFKQPAVLKFCGRGDGQKMFNFGRGRFGCAAGIPPKANPKTAQDRQFNMLRADDNACEMFKWSIQHFCDWLSSPTTPAVSPDNCVELLSPWLDVLLSFLEHDTIVDTWQRAEEQRKQAAKEMTEAWAAFDDDLGFDM